MQAGQLRLCFAEMVASELFASQLRLRKASQGVHQFDLVFEAEKFGFSGVFLVVMPISQSRVVPTGTSFRCRSGFLLPPASEVLYGSV